MLIFSYEISEMQKGEITDSYWSQQLCALQSPVWNWFGPKYTTNITSFTHAHRMNDALLLPALVFSVILNQTYLISQFSKCTSLSEQQISKWKKHIILWCVCVCVCLFVCVDLTNQTNKAALDEYKELRIYHGNYRGPQVSRKQ